jgi:hypothetical protein
VTRLPSGQRYFDDSDGRRVLFPGFDESRRRIVIYCRVSSPGRRVSCRLFGLCRYVNTVKDEPAGGGR